MTVNTLIDLHIAEISLLYKSLLYSGHSTFCSLIGWYTFFSILLTHEGSHREVYRDFQPSLTSSAGGAKGYSDHRFRAPPAYTVQLPTLYQHRANNRSKRKDNWKKRKKETAKLVREAKKDYYNRYVSLAKETNDPKLYYWAIANLKNKTVRPPFSACDLFPGDSEERVAEKTADFFAGIGSDFEPLKEEDAAVPEQTNAFITVSESDITNRLRKCKKPRGMLRGDIWPDMVTEAAPFLARPLTAVINACLQQICWPKVWKLETVSVIPKKDHPSNLGETRNISCALVFAKLLEFFVLEELKSQMRPGPDQYGGLPGMSTNHYLAKTLTNVLLNLDQANSACALISVDFAKAFNSMDHGRCLEALEEGGVSQPLIGMIKAFLTSRVMQYTIGSSLSTARPVRGGAPPGYITW